MYRNYIKLKQIKGCLTTLRLFIKPRYMKGYLHCILSKPCYNTRQENQKYLDKFIKISPIFIKRVIPNSNSRHLFHPSLIEQ